MSKGWTGSSFRKGTSAAALGIAFLRQLFDKVARRIFHVPVSGVPLNQIVQAPKKFVLQHAALAQFGAGVQNFRGRMVGDQAVMDGADAQDVRHAGTAENLARQRVQGPEIEYRLGCHFFGPA